MTTEPNNESAPEGRFAGMPYDWRRPTKRKFIARLWNPDDPHLFPAKAFGAGWSVNVYWLLHPLRYARA